jgi:hypothetical protein
MSQLKVRQELDKLAKEFHGILCAWSVDSTKARGHKFRKLAEIGVMAIEFMKLKKELKDAEFYYMDYMSIDTAKYHDYVYGKFTNKAKELDNKIIELEGGKSE